MRLRVVKNYFATNMVNCFKNIYEIEKSTKREQLLGLQI